MALMDEFKEEREQIKNAPFKKRLEYFWEYNKTPVIICTVLVIMFSSILYNYFTQKDTALWVAFIDCLEDDTLAAEYEANLTEVLGVNTNDEEVKLDTSYLVSASADYADNSLTEALSVRVATGEIDAFLSGENFFSAYAVGDVFVDLRTVLSPEDLAYYEDSLYYLDYARIEDGYDFDIDTSSNQTLDDINHLLQMQPQNPETMEDPVPVGIYVNPTEEFSQAYQFSKKENLVFGVIYNHCDVENIMTFLNMITGRNS